jgi:hypothetical protein
VCVYTQLIKTKKKETLTEQREIKILKKLLNYFVLERNEREIFVVEDLFQL